MKVLIISSDSSFFETALAGDAWQRHSAYASGVERLFIIVKTNKRYEPMYRGNLTVYASGGRGIFAFKNILTLGQALIEKEKINLINAQDPFWHGLIGYLLKKKFKLPLVINWHGDFLNNPYWLKEKFINCFLLILAKFLTKRADCLRVTSPVLKEKLVNQEDIEEKKIRVIPTPVDLNKFASAKPEAIEELRKQYEGKKIILFAGRLVAVKNISFCLRAMPELLKSEPTACLLIAGSGPLKTALENLTAKLNIKNNVAFAGAVPHQDLPAYYAFSGCLVLPSKHESFGKVILEAGMQACPVLASKTTGALSIIKNEQLLFKVNDQTEFLSKLSALLGSKALRDGFGRELKNDIQNNYSWGKSVSEIINMWQSFNHL